MTSEARLVVFENVSKFYGEVLGVNKVSFSLGPGITSLVGPNGSGKTTLMNLLTGLIRPSQGAIYVLGLTPQQPIEFFRQVGYCTQFDSFPPGTNGYDFIYWPLRLHGFLPVSSLNRCRQGREDGRIQAVDGFFASRAGRLRLVNQRRDSHPPSGQATPYGSLAP